MIKNKKVSKDIEIQKKTLLRNCIYCNYAKRPREDLPYLCTNSRAIGFAFPWNMPIENCTDFIKRI